LLHVVLAALNRTDGNRINDEERFPAGLDDEQSAQTLEHAHG
jgi:hypothetical protein